ncbi:MAG: hypothetical protein DRQ49_13620 [Gammaproteobacteria bacterium]|nr:MAG: hypothetical protein DRQ49_13620 [Gammaproteobacteria bacterium]RKZ73638.1 MAG: hypothetical protein DRQ57_13745 [Gammaproteobacteria bacterium]
MVKPVHINISLPEKWISHIDEYAHYHQITRSAFIAMAAQKILMSQ